MNSKEAAEAAGENDKVEEDYEMILIRLVMALLMLADGMEGRI